MISQAQQAEQLIKEAHEAKMLKQFLAKKFSRYGGITHEELENLCTVFGITKEGDSA